MAGKIKIKYLYQPTSPKVIRKRKRKRKRRNFTEFLVNVMGMLLSAGSYARKSGDVFNIRKVKQTLAIIIAVNLLIGIAMIVIGVTNLSHHRLSYDRTPTGMWYVQDYLLMTSIGSIYFTISCFGYAGICESRNTYAKAFTIASIAFGFGLLQVFLVWISTINFLIPEEMQTAEFTHEYYFFVILVAGIAQLFCGFFSYLISMNYVHSRGYYSLNEEEADQADFFEQLESGMKEDEEYRQGARKTF